MGVVKKRTYKPLNRTNVDRAIEIVLYKKAKDIQEGIILTLIAMFILSLVANVIVSNAILFDSDEQQAYAPVEIKTKDGGV